MAVIPFPKATAREPVAFSLGARIDLRLGAPAAAVVRPYGEDALNFTGLSRLVRAARMTWRARSAIGQLSLVVPDAAHALMDADTLDAAAVEAGCTRKSLTFEFEERALIAAGPALAEGLRARGWGVALRGDAACPLPFGAAARALYTELVIETPREMSPFFAVDAHHDQLLCRRIFAAKEAGMVITAEMLNAPAEARMLAIAGFDRGGAPWLVS